MDSGKSNIYSFAHTGKLHPQEEMLEIKKERKNLSIGIPKEISFQENRIALVPSAVKVLVENGHEVLVENDAGEAAHFYNKEYSDAGAQIVYSAEEVYKADLIIKIAPPSVEEIAMMKQNQKLLSALNFTAQKVEYFKKMVAKKITAISFENIKDRSGSFPVRRSMSEIVGNAAILIAAEYLCNPSFGKGYMLGGFPGIKPSEVVILGAGTVSEYAARAALGMGAHVKVFDNAIYKLHTIQRNLNNRLYTSIIHPVVLSNALKSANVAIGAIHSVADRTHCVITEEMVSQMKPGSVIVDVSIDQGGCFETSRETNHKNPVFVKHDVTHYCVPNIASRVPHTASYALSNFVTPILQNMGEEGGLDNLVKRDSGVLQGVYMLNGTITNKFIGEYFSLPFQDIELLMATFS